MKRKLSIVGVRHANTNKKTEGQDDAERQLTEKGFEQAARMRVLLKNMQFDRAIVSSVLRTRQTFAAITNPAQIKESIHFLPEFYLPLDPEDNRLLDIMFAELAYAPLAEYRKHEHASALDRYAEAALDALERFVPDDANDQQEVKILIVGHAVCLPAILARSLENFVPTSAITDTIINTSLGECEAFVCEWYVDKTDVPMITHLT